MSVDLLKNLREAAAKATPGDWCPSNIADPHDNMIEQRDVSAYVDGPVICTIEDCYKPNQEYIALCSPENILTLCTELERLREMEREARELAEFYGSERSWGGYHADVDTIMDDHTPTKADDGFPINLGGKRARIFLSKWAAPVEGEKKND